jgi:hypothetical protein
MPLPPGYPLLRACYAFWAIGSGILLVAMISGSPEKEIYDEPYHMGTVRLVQQDGFRKALVSDRNQSAAGPLFAFMHLTAAGLTRLAAPHIRFVNVAMLVGTLCAVWAALRNSTPFAFEASVSIIAVPQVWKSAGIALTEMPAMCFFAVFMALWLRRHKHSTRSECCFHGALAGLALGAAILGRQTYLVAVVALVVSAIAYPSVRLRSIAAIASSIVASAWLFVLWGALVPPSQRFVDSGPSLINAICSLSYFGMMSFVLWPQRYFQPRPWAVALSLAIGLLLSLVLADAVPMPGQGIVGKVLPESLQFAPSIALRALFIAIGCVWGMQLLLESWHDRRDPAATFVHTNTLLLALAPAKVSHIWSSRYTVGGASAECLRSAAFRPSYLHLIVLACGTVAGALSLWSHYSYG